MSFNNTLGIKYDAKFVRLVNRLLYEHAQVRSSDQAMSNLRNSNLLSRNLSDILSNKNKEMKEQSETTLKHIFKYIDRRVERAVLEERNKEPILKLREYPPVDIRYYANPLSDNRAEMMRVNPDGLCYINKDYCADERVLKNLKKALVEQIIKIDPALLMIKDHSLGFEGLFHESLLDFKERTIVVFFRFDGMGLGLRFKSNNGLIEINLPEIAKYFSDEVNKIARDKYANCL